jgi:hypothetical protein
VGGAKGLPRAGPLQGVIYNPMTKYYMRAACPGFFDKIDTDLPKGAIAALETLCESTRSDEFMTILGSGSEKKFHTEWKKSVESAASEFTWKLDKIRAARTDTVYAVIGALRGDSMKGKQFLQLLGQHFIVSPEFAAAIKIPDFKERASKCLPFIFADGAMIRSRVIVSVDQTVNGETQKGVDHMLTLEISLTPRIGKKNILASESILEMTEEPLTAGQWTIADVNFSLSDNYPLDPPDEPTKDDTKKE